jgi:hypothetical protein
MRHPLWLRWFAFILLVSVAAALVWAATVTDEEFEKASKLEKALKGDPPKPPKLDKDPDIEGKTFEAEPAFGAKGCKAKFEFPIAKKGTFPHREFEYDLNGVYVKIKASFDKAKCDQRCEEVKILQVLRDFTKNAKGEKESIKPDTKKMQERAGWDQKDAASRGWRVDSGDNAPFFGPGGVPGSAENGTTDTPSVERDLPSFSDTFKREPVRKVGKELIACAVCVNKEKPSKIIACLTWGFYVDEKGNVAFDPKPPVGSGPPPPPPTVKDALDRFEKLPGNTESNIKF